MEKIIETPCGKIKGYNCRIPGVTAFKGIRFAVAERWKYPEEITGWEGIYDASSYGNCCFQPRSFYNEEENLKKVFIITNSVRAKRIITAKTAFF